MRSSGRLGRALLLNVILLMFSHSSGVRAAPDEDRTLEEAKALFREGVVLLEQGEPEAALDRFLRSRAFVPSAQNTVNAAICLQQLGRNDEALELYEDVAARFAGELAESDGENLGLVIGELAQKVGRLELSGGQEGDLVVDDRKRANLPLVRSLPLLPGKRSISIVVAGRVTFERDVEIRVGATTILDAQLEPEAPGDGSVRAPRAERKSVAPPAFPRPSRRWTFELGLHGGGIYAPRLNGSADGGCRPGSCTGGGDLLGGRARLSLAARHAIGLGPEVRVGYAVLSQHFNRSLIDGVGTATTNYAIKQDTSVDGPFAEALVGFDWRVLPNTSLSPALGAGLFFSQQSIVVSGFVWADGSWVELREEERSGIGDLAPFAALALGSKQHFGPWTAHLAVEAWFLFAEGPREGPNLATSSSCMPGASGSCPSSPRSLANERVRGPTWSVSPEVGVGYTF